jgi:aspartyl-tRNA(Asn)/glutamyl-tRNA(Gln) amidotransferase subunit B
MRRQAIRTGLGLKAQINTVGLRPEELFLSGPAAGLPDLQYKQPIVGEGEVIVDRRPDSRGQVRGHRGRHRAPASRAGRRQVDARPAPDHVLCRPQPLGRGADGDRLEARHALADEAKAYVTKLRTILRYLGTCDGNMEKGSCAPTSTSRCASRAAPFGTRCEIKNVNSIRFIGQAIEVRGAPPDRHLEDGGSIDQETRLFDPGKGETRSMRSKEEAHDYRYFPDPDLLPLEFDQAYVDDLAKDLPELPDDKKARFVRARPVGL